MADLENLLLQLQTLQGQIKKDVDEKLHSKKEVVFLPWKASCWDAMESVWQAAAADPDYEVSVVPIPWRYRDVNSSAKPEVQYEGDRFPSHVPIIPYKEFDLPARHPYMVVFQNPYDHCNYTTSVEPAYYSYLLKAHSENLVYIPWFVTDDIDYNDPLDGKAVYNMRYYVTVPGVIHADTVIVQSEQMRKSYIEVLTQFTGEDSRPQWEQKIFGFGSPLLKQPDIGSKIWENMKLIAAKNTQKE